MVPTMICTAFNTDRISSVLTLICTAINTDRISSGEFVYNIEFNHIHNYGSTISSDYGGIYIGGGGVNNYDDDDGTVITKT